MNIIELKDWDSNKLFKIYLSNLQLPPMKNLFLMAVILMVSLSFSLRIHRPHEQA